MNIALFKIWLIKNGTSKKIATDNISRIKRIDNELIASINSSIDKEYTKDKCDELIKCFSNYGQNTFMKNYNLKNLPIGKAQIHCYKLSLVKYLSFKKDYPFG